MIQAVMEGVCYAMRNSYECLKIANKDDGDGDGDECEQKPLVDRLIVVGGGSKSTFWLKTLATCINVPLEVPLSDRDSDSEGDSEGDSECGDKSDGNTKPINVTANANVNVNAIGPALGAARLAIIGHQNIQSPYEKVIKKPIIVKTIYPVHDLVDVYNEGYLHFKKNYSLLKSMQM